MTKNYLNNKDLLREIHLSKTTYCTFTNPEYNQYDIILPNVSAVNDETIELAKTNRKNRFMKEYGEAIEPKTEDLIFRITSWEHIPLLPPKQTKAEKNSEISVNKFFEDIFEEDNEEVIEELEDQFDPLNSVKADHIRLNFPPFFHYKIENNDLILVGKSHWQGDLNDGKFSKTHGYVTDNMAKMLILLADRYSSKGSWRNYSYKDEMVGQAVMQLVQVVLQFDESRGNNPFAFLTTITTNAFRRILNLEKKSQEIRDKLLVMNGMSPSYSQQGKDADFNYEGNSE